MSGDEARGRTASHPIQPRHEREERSTDMSARTAPTPQFSSTDAPAPVLTLRGVSRVHGEGEARVVALADADLEIYPGELVAVMGPSGSGKSTLLNLAGALDRATTGQVIIEGEDVGALKPDALARLRRRRIGFVFQDFNLIPSLTAAENVALPLELDGARPSRARRNAVDALHSMGLTELADRYPDHMSGGQQQRVAIARALVGSRRLILADEPTGALDSHTGEAVLQVLRDRCDAGAAGLLVTHEARHAAWADRVVFLRDGRIVDSTGRRDDPDALLGDGRDLGSPRGGSPGFGSRGDAGTPKRDGAGSSYQRRR